MRKRDTQSYELTELCRRANVSPRTVRYYIQQGLLPSPGMGPGTRYGRTHLDRLRLIRQLQREHLPLAEIRRRLERMDDDEVAAALGAPGDSGLTLRMLTEDPSSADGQRRSNPVTDYVTHALQSSRPAPEGVARAKTELRSRADGTVHYERDQWDRFRLHDDVEIHVRRPLSRDLNKRVERLLQAAREILGEMP